MRPSASSPETMSKYTCVLLATHSGEVPSCTHLCGDLRAFGSLRALRKEDESEGQDQEERDDSFLKGSHDDGFVVLFNQRSNGLFVLRSPWGGAMKEEVLKRGVLVLPAPSHLR